MQDWFYSLFQMIPYRCKACKARFYAYRSGETSSKMRTSEELKVVALRRKRKWQHTKKAIALYALGAAVLVVCLFIFMQQRVE